MSSGCGSSCARLAEWWIRRNPMYLLSAACMAVGARLYLVAPRTRAGEVGVILLTLGILQAYEAAVGSILLLLHRRRRSPEDEPSLLLVLALFWTGPMAATAEMTAHRAVLGLICAVGASAIAMAELRIVCRAIGLRMSESGRAIALACLGLLTTAPLLLAVPPNADGSNEIRQYFTWWALAGIALLAVWAVRFHTRELRFDADSYGHWRSLHIELAFLAIAVAAAATHLYAMNYAFFGHARAFYASPLIVAVAIVAMEYLARTRQRSRWLLIACGCLPVVAIELATQRFDPYIRVARLPTLFRDPLPSVLFLAALAWWFGSLRLASGPMFHIGSASLAAAFLRGFHGTLPGITTATSPCGATTLDPRVIALALYAIAAYLLMVAWLRRSRLDALAAIVVHLAAVAVLVTNRVHGDIMILCFVAGWSWVVGQHLLVRRASLLITVWPIIFMLAVSWVHEFDNTLAWGARAHVFAMVGVLLAAGYLRPWTRYQFTAIGAATAEACFLAGRWMVSGRYGTAAAVVTSSFLLLLAGSAISWHKPALLTLARRDEPSEAMD